ncbi:MAG: hypothetical protein KDA60_19120, partial [Planctomycetales bacterium]|nr:hypothetical protein [Planctomycetales bacterium]
TLGHVFDWIIEDGNWSPRFLAVCLSPERDDVKVLISHLWVKHVDLQNNTVQLRLTPEEIQRSPKYDPNEAVNRRYELRTYDFTGRPINWGVTSE